MRFLIDSSASTIQSEFCLVFFKCATSFPVLFTSKFARHCGWHLNFQLSTIVFHVMLKFFIIWFNEEDTTSLSGVIELWFLDCPLLLLFAFRCIRHVSTYMAIHCGVLRSFFLVNLLPDHVNPSGGLSFNKMNLVKPVHASDNSFYPSTFQ